MAVATRQQDKVEVIRELSQAGATTYGLLKSESRYLPRILHKDEHIHAIVYGQHHSSSAMLVATDERVIYLDKKPMAAFIDEVTYDVVSGIELDIHTFFATVTLHTAVTNYVIRFVNIHCADTFVDYIEAQRLKREVERNGRNSNLNSGAIRNVKERTVRRLGPKIVNDLAGYYWIPLEEERDEAA